MPPKHSLSERTYSGEELREVAYLAAGIGSGAVMRHAPHVVMPTEDIEAALEDLLADVRDGVLDLDKGDSQ